VTIDPFFKSAISNMLFVILLKTAIKFLLQNYFIVINKYIFGRLLPIQLNIVSLDTIEYFAM